MTPQNGYPSNQSALFTDAEWMRGWVAACVAERNNGATDEEISRLTKRFRRMVPVLMGATAAHPAAGGGDPAAEFKSELQSLRVGGHG